jgi:hypothetical protein
LGGRVFAVGFKDTAGLEYVALYVIVVLGHGKGNSTGDDASAQEARDVEYVDIA